MTRKLSAAQRAVEYLRAVAGTHSIKTHLPELASALLREDRATPYDGYFVRSDGSVWSDSDWRGYGRRMLIGQPNSHGYLRVRIQHQGVRRSVFIHKLVAEAFHGSKPSEDHEVRHLNGIRVDNRAANIRWGTRKENAADRKAHGKEMAAKNGKASVAKMLKTRRAMHGY